MRVAARHGPMDHAVPVPRDALESTRDSRVWPGRHRSPAPSTLRPVCRKPTRNTPLARSSSVVGGNSHDSGSRPLLSEGIPLRGCRGIRTEVRRLLGRLNPSLLRKTVRSSGRHRQSRSAPVQELEVRKRDLTKSAGPTDALPATIHAAILRLSSRRAGRLRGESLGTPSGSCNGVMGAVFRFVYRASFMQSGTSRFLGGGGKATRRRFRRARSPGCSRRARALPRHRPRSPDVMVRFREFDYRGWRRNR